MKKACVVCGGEFEARHRLRVTCCSDAAHRRGRINLRRRLSSDTRTCAVCGDSFSAAGAAPKKTCSAACSVLHKKSRDARRHQRQYVPAGTIKQCIVCGKDFAFHRNKKTCSRECNRERNRTLSALGAARNPERVREYQRKHRAAKSAAYRLVAEIKSRGLEALL